MSPTFRQRRFLLAAVSLACAAGVACAAPAAHNAAAGPGHRARTADLQGRDTGCGTNGCGTGAQPGTGGQPGHSGQPGHGGDGGDGGRGGDSGGCGDGGDGGQGGDSGQDGGPGQPGQPGKPGTHGCTRYEDLPDKPKEKLTLADKVRIVLVVLHGPTTSAEAAKKYKMSAHEIDTWKQAYLAGDWSTLMK